MEEAKRNSRPDLDRCGPNRVAQSRQLNDGNSAAIDDLPAQTVDEVVARAVRAGYQVVEENITQGRIAAQRLRDRRYEVSDIPDDVSAVSKRVLQLARDLSTSWFDLVAAVLRDPVLRDAFERKPEDVAKPGAEPRSGEPPKPATIPVTCVLRTSRDAEADPVFLTRLDNPTVPTLTGLHAGGLNLSPIERAVFRRATDGNSLVLYIEIPDEQPPGIYHGVVVDSNSDRPLGTVSVRVGQPQ